MINNLQPVIQNIANSAKEDRAAIERRRNVIKDLENRILVLKTEIKFLDKRAVEFDLAHDTLCRLT